MYDFGAFSDVWLSDKIWFLHLGCFEAFYGKQLRKNLIYLKVVSKDNSCFVVFPQTAAALIFLLRQRFFFNFSLDNICFFISPKTTIVLCFNWDNSCTLFHLKTMADLISLQKTTAFIPTQLTADIFQLQTSLPNRH